MLTKQSTTNSTTTINRYYYYYHYYYYYGPTGANTGANGGQQTRATDFAAGGVLTGP